PSAVSPSPKRRATWPRRCSNAGVDNSDNFQKKSRRRIYPRRLFRGRSPRRERPAKEREWLLDRRGLSGNRTWIIAVRAGPRTRISIPCEHIRHGFHRGLERLLPSHFLAGVGGHAPHDGGQGALRGIVGVVVRRILADEIV